MIANRFNPLGRNLGKTAKSYIQDGLIHMWDGIENAGFGVHEDNPIAWKDLIGGLDFSIYNNTDVAFGEDCVLMNATTSAMVANAKITNIKTFEIVLERSNDIHCFSPVGFEPSGGTLQILFNSSTSLSVERYVGVTVPSKLFSLTVIRDDSSTIACYVNGVNAPLQSLSGSNYFYDSGSNTATFGRKKYASNFRGKIKCCRVYTKQFSADEVSQNTLVDIARFGIQV